jgi:TRAP-type mannitol/chloroaromatic compound transport system substrate-binding protein
MQRRRLITAAPLGLAILARPALAQTPPPVQWRLAGDFARVQSLPASAADYLCGRVAALTDNRFQITPATAGEPIPAGGVLAAVKAGKVEIGYVRPALYAAATPALGFAGGMPFGLSVRGQMAWLRHGGGEALINGVFATLGCLGLPAGSSGAGFGGWWRRELRSAADLAGRKIGIEGPGAQVLAQLGGLPQPTPAADLATALQKGAIEAGFCGGPVDGADLGLDHGAKLVYTPGWQAGSETFWAVIAQDKWRDLAPAYKAALQAACFDTASWLQARYDADSPAALHRLAAAGVVVKPLSAAVLEALTQATATWLRGQAASDAAFKKILAPWQEFAAAENPWLGLDESRAVAAPAKVG